jgi:hypothetical protein
MLKRLGDLLHSRFAPALLLALVAILAYALLLTQMGFYWDDLPMSWIRYELGPEAMTRYFSNNRPVWGWLYQITTRLFPQVPIYWQLFALFWRWTGAVLVWAIVRNLWPKQTTFAVGVSLLFLIYPGFNAQWAAYLYSHFFIVLSFFLFSQLCMLWSIGRPSWQLTTAGMVFSALNLWMMEYFYVLELARGAILWTALRNEPHDQPKRNKRTQRDRQTGHQQRIQHLKRFFLLWAPYLGVFAAAVLSRLFIFNNQVYGLGLLPRLKTDFLATLIALVQNALISFWTVSVAAWGQAFQLPDPAMHGPRTMLVYAGVIGVTVAALLIFLWKNADGPEGRFEGRNAWWAVGLGLIMLPFASAPFWLIDLPVTLGFPANRFTLPSMLGVSLIAGGLVYRIPAARARNILLALLVGLGAGRQFLWASDFSRDWAVQRNLFWQMAWRIPALQPDTIILMNEHLKFYADNSLGPVVNWIYASENRSSRIDYVLLYPTNRLGKSLPALEPDLPIRYDFLAGVFEGNTSQVVSIYFSPPACLHVLDPELDPANRFIQGDGLMREAARLSSTEHILAEQTVRMPDIYGPEPAHGWCYFFEKADLARQLGDWEQVTELGEQAFALADHPNDPTERFVFIEGYAHMHDWAAALKYSSEAHRVSPSFVDPLLCGLWSRIETETAPGPEKDAALVEVRTKYSCSP